MLLASLSAITLVVSLIHARMIGGFPYYDPTLLWYYRVGFFSALSGFVFGLIGKGVLYWRALSFSLFLSALWFLLALSE